MNTNTNKYQFSVVYQKEYNLPLTSRAVETLDRAKMRERTLCVKGTQQCLMFT